MKALALALLVVSSAVLAGCALPDRRPCDWVVLQAYPSPFNASNLSLHVYGTNCGRTDLQVDEAECLPLEGLYPRTRIGNGTYVLGVNASAVPEEEIPCPGAPAGAGRAPPRTGPSLAGLTWDGTIREGNETRPAPPGDYQIRAHAFGRFDVARVTLHEDGAFSGGKQH